jgi:uncharacterized membrane protein YraQ (UPF0718 family)/copper chaperone CopZ
MFQAALQVLLELSPWLLLGTLIAALLHVLLPAGFIRRRLRGPGAVFQAVGLGVPLPLCSCGVIPAGVGLKKDGASDGAAIGFLISTPQTGIDAIFVSAAFFGWPFAMFKVFGAAITGIVGGLLTEAYSPNASELSPPSSGEAHSRKGAVEIFRHGLEILRSIWLWLVVGIVVSAVIEVLLPPAWIGQVQATGGILLSASAALLISLPLYVCATASVPIAGALVAKGLPAGAALVFLMAGPATNVATIGTIYRTFGRRVFLIYLMTIILGSFGLALAFDWLAPTLVIGVLAEEHDHTSWWRVGSSLLLMLAFAWFAFEDLGRLWHRLRRQRPAFAGGYRVEIRGMTCDRCAGRLESTLRAADGVQSATVQFDSEEAIVNGSIDKSQLFDEIRGAGFEPGVAETLK